MRDIQLIQIKSDVGAGRKGALLGPAALHDILLRDCSETQKLPTITLTPEVAAEHFSVPCARNIEAIARFCTQKIAPLISEKVRTHTLFVLSGDHANAIGIVQGLRHAEPTKRVGIVWVDAHSDLHSIYTTPSGNVHGMSLAAVLGDDNGAQQMHKADEEAQKWWRLLQTPTPEMARAISPEDVIFIGLRSLEEAEKSIISHHGISVFDIAMLRTQGVAKAIEQINKKLKNIDLLYVSFDVDALDTSVIEGATGTPVEGGLYADEITHLLAALATHPKLCVMEATEYNPVLDDEHYTAGRRVADILCKILHVLRS